MANLGSGDTPVAITANAGRRPNMLQGNRSSSRACDTAIHIRLRDNGLWQERGTGGCGAVTK
jgi:hypothetical protein